MNNINLYVIRNLKTNKFYYKNDIWVDDLGEAHLYKYKFVAKRKAHFLNDEFKDTYNIDAVVFEVHIKLGIPL